MEIAEDIFVGKTYLDGDVMKCTGNNTFWLQCNFSNYTKNIIDFNEIYLFPQKQHSISNNSDAVQARNDTLSFAISAFKRLLELWRTRANPNERLTPKEFIDWTLSMDHKIEWLDWTIERGLVDPDHLKNHRKKDVSASVQFAEFGRKAHEYKKPVRDEFQTAIEEIAIPLIEKGRNDTDITRDIYRYYEQSVGDKGEENSLRFELSNGEIIEYGFHTIRKMIPNFKK